MLRIIVTETWKLFKERHYKGFGKFSIAEFADILAKESLDQANKTDILLVTNILNIVSTVSTEIESEVSVLISQVCTIKDSMHTKNLLKEENR